MKVIQGRALTYKGASRQRLSLDFGTWFVSCDEAIIDPANERRVTGTGRFGVVNVATGDREYEVTASVSWALDNQDKASEVVGEAIGPGGESITFGSGVEKNVTMIEKSLEGTALIV